MSKRLSAYTRNRNRIMRYINTLKHKGYKVELNIPTERQVKESGVTGKELTKLTRELKKITSNTLKEIAIEAKKDYDMNVAFNSSYSTIVIDNLRAELSKFKPEISDKINALLNQIIQQQGEDDLVYALNKMNESFFTTLYRVQFDSDSAIQNFSTSIIENLPQASEQYKMDLMDAFESDELGYIIED